MSKISKWKKRIESVCPTIKVEAIAVNDSGQNNTVVTVNHEWVFRFPKYQEEFVNATKEYHVLKVLQKHISLPIPVPQYAHLETKNYKDAYIGYRLIPGRPLFKQSFLALEDHDKLAQQLGTFLRELHSVPTADVQSLDLKTLDSRKTWMKFYKEVRDHLYPMMREDATRKLSMLFETFLNDPRNFTFEPKLIHGDFGPTNILYKDSDISGILDFGECSIDDPAIDIAALIGKFGYGEGFIKLMEPAYPNVLDYLNRAKFYASTFALQDALFGYKHKNKELLQYGLEDYV